MYRFVSDKSRSLRSDHSVLAGATGTIPANAVVLGDEIFTHVTSTSYSYKGDVWMRVSSVNGSPYFGWTAVSHLGKPQGSFQEIPDGIGGSDSIKIIKAVVTYEQGGVTLTKELFPDEG